MVERARRFYGSAAGEALGADDAAATRPPRCQRRSRQLSWRSGASVDRTVPAGSGPAQSESLPATELSPHAPPQGNTEGRRRRRRRAPPAKGGRRPKAEGSRKEPRFPAICNDGGAAACDG